MTIKENLLGYDSEFDLYKQLLDKSIFVFPEYEKRARQGISKHTANLIAEGTYSSNKFIPFSYGKNDRLFYHLKKLSEKGFASYPSGQRKGYLRLNLKNIKTDWLEANCQKTNEEFKDRTIERIAMSLERISQGAHELINESDSLTFLSDVAANLELLESNMQTYAFNSNVESKNDC